MKPLFLLFLTISFSSCMKDYESAKDHESAQETTRYTGPSAKLIVYTSNYAHSNWSYKVGFMVEGKLPYILATPECDGMASYQISVPIGYEYRIHINTNSLGQSTWIESRTIKIDSAKCYSIDVH